MAQAALLTMASLSPFESNGAEHQPMCAVFERSLVHCAKSMALRRYISQKPALV